MNIVNPGFAIFFIHAALIGYCGFASWNTLGNNTEQKWAYRIVAVVGLVAFSGFAVAGMMGKV